MREMTETEWLKGDRSYIVTDVQSGEKLPCVSCSTAEERMFKVVKLIPPEVKEGRARLAELKARWHGMAWDWRAIDFDEAEELLLEIVDLEKKLGIRKKYVEPNGHTYWV